MAFQSTQRYMAYDGDGIEVGYLTLAEARERFPAAEYEAESGTITVTREDEDTPKWRVITEAEAERILAAAEDDGIAVKFLVPPRAQGQIVECAYTGLGESGIMRRTVDRSDRSTSYAVRDWTDDDEDTPGLNREPA